MNVQLGDPVEDRRATHVTASPASSAPPGRRMPNVTATASQIRPMIGGALVFGERSVRHARTSRRRSRRSRRQREQRDLDCGRRDPRRARRDLASCAPRTSARPDADFCRLWIASVMTPKTTSSISTSCCGLREVERLEPEDVERRGSGTSSRAGRCRCPAIWNSVRSSAERERERRERQREHAQSADRERDERAERAADERAHDGSDREVDLAVADARNGTSMPDSRGSTRPTGHEPAGGDERALGQAHHAAEAGDDDEREEHDAQRQARARGCPSDSKSRPGPAHGNHCSVKRDEERG